MATSKISKLTDVKLTNGSEEISHFNVFYIRLTDSYVTGANYMGVVYQRGAETIYTWDYNGYQNQFKLSTNGNTIIVSHVYTTTPNQNPPIIVSIIGIC